MPRVGSKARTRARKLAASQLDGVNGDDIADRICGTIAAAIAEGALRPGNKILEDVLADHFRVSRTVVRGALGILQREHLLERRRNHGTFVAEPSIKEATQLFEARRALERLVLEYVMLRARPEDLDRLERLVDEELRIHRSGDERKDEAVRQVSRGVVAPRPKRGHDGDARKARRPHLSGDGPLRRRVARRLRRGRSPGDPGRLEGRPPGGGKS